MSEGRRLTFLGAVKVNEVVVDDLSTVFHFKPGDLVQIGRQEPFALLERDLESE